MIVCISGVGLVLFSALSACVIVIVLTWFGLAYVEVFIRCRLPNTTAIYERSILVGLQLECILTI